jgi:nitrogen fixation protein FixH
VRGLHVLVLLVAFFCIVIGVNAIMIYSAVTTHSGVVAAEPYRKGLHYNERVEADERQQRLRWDQALSVERTGNIALILTDAGGRRIHGLDVRLVIGRPSTNRQDIEVALLADDAGRYVASIAPLQPGAWIATVEARASATDSEPVFRARRRLWLAQ